MSLSNMLVSSSNAAASFTQRILTMLSLCLLVENTHVLPVEKAEFAKRKKKSRIHFHYYEIVNS